MNSFSIAAAPRGMWIWRFADWSTEGFRDEGGYRVVECDPWALSGGIIMCIHDDLQGKLSYMNCLGDRSSLIRTKCHVSNR